MRVAIGVETDFCWCCFSAAEAELLRYLCGVCYHTSDSGSSIHTERHDDVQDIYGKAIAV